ncbi:MAG: DegT/DnrJ/EryC1/StrS family aminotransferase [Alphaproteobacteria bacterium]
MPGDTLTIPLMRPRLPDAEALLPYLREIDRARWYTNFGQLLDRFERRLAETFRVEVGQITCVANGTLGLTLALKALEPAPGALCAMPSWTFAATPGAACAAGLVPWFLDVDEGTWALEPRALKARLREAPGPVAAVVPVSPFGAPVDVAAWQALSEETGLPVAIDAAAAFDSLSIGRSPAVVSLHATKVFGIGEGAMVASTDEGMTARVRRLSNYGFGKGAQVAAPGINAKMSEYAAAVGLAALDAWPAMRRTYVELTQAYGAAFDAAEGISMAPSFGAGRVSSTCNVDLGAPVADEVITRLSARGIETRRWWGRGCHRYPAFADFPRTALPVTERLADSIIGLPFFPGLTEPEVMQVRDAVCAALSG